MEIRADSKDFSRIYENLTDEPIKAVITEVITSLKNDRIVGEHVKYETIPKYYIKRHNIQTLYRVSLPHGWRLVYSIHSFYENEKTVLMLELMNHHQYNKRFGYFKKRSA